MDNKKVIGVAQVLQHLKDGMTRADIAKHYDITMGECKILFQHEDLKNKKTIKPPTFVIVADASQVDLEDSIKEIEVNNVIEVSSDIVAGDQEEVKAEVKDKIETEVEEKEDKTEVDTAVPATKPKPVWN